MAFTLNSPAIRDGAFVPARHACTGDNISPPFEWSGAPDGAKSFALLCEDPDAPSGMFRHWAIFDIAPENAALAEALPPSPYLPGGMRQAVNDFGKPGYGGPCPPKGHGVHHYHFRLVALEVARLDLPANPSCRQVAEAVRAHALGLAEIVGLFER
jgi:Raf kinase inhibitor-like YbhB/YbcL family protein